MDDKDKYIKSLEAELLDLRNYALKVNDWAAECEFVLNSETLRGVTLFKLGLLWAKRPWLKSP